MKAIKGSTLVLKFKFKPNYEGRYYIVSFVCNKPFNFDITIQVQATLEDVIFREGIHLKII